MSPARRWPLLAAGVLCVAAAAGPAPAEKADGPTVLPPPRAVEGGAAGPQEQTLAPDTALPPDAGPAAPPARDVRHYEGATAAPGAPRSLWQRAGWVRFKCCLQSLFLGFPEEFEEVPFGYDLYAHGRTMVANGEAAGMVFYNYDFIDGHPELNLRGLDHLVRVAHLLTTNPAPIVIERTPCAPGLAEARRLVVLNELAQGPCPVPPERVVIGKPLAPGLSGREAELIYGNLLLQVQSTGARAVLGVGNAPTGTSGTTTGAGGGVGSLGR